VESEGDEFSATDIGRMMMIYSMSLKRSLKRTYKNSSMSPKRAQIKTHRHRNN
jgi:hypothetical protein